MSRLLRPGRLPGSTIARTVALRRLVSSSPTLLSDTGRPSGSDSSSGPSHKPSQASSGSSPGMFGSRPGPPLLPPEEQREFEELVRKAQAPLSSGGPKTHTTSANSTGGNSSIESTLEVLERHPDARKPLPPEFEGEVNPATGERGGPKREPLKHGDWSFGGRVTDF